MTERILPRQGVITLYGYGIRLSVDRGHLLIEDGIGSSRRSGRFARVGHGLRRVVVIGSDGFVSLRAIRWLADQNASFVMLERDGHVLATTGPAHSSDVRLRRLQAVAENVGTGMQLAAKLIRQKLVGQENVARKRFNNQTIADRIAIFRNKLQSVRRFEDFLSIESNAALEYWSAWSNLQIQFPRADLARVPDHWQVFGTRVSPLTKSPRLAVNPPNAVLNYLYAVLESEARLAAAQLGLDPELGVLHKDRANRASLASDLMEPVRPLVDSFVFDWLTCGPLRREWFFEETNGNCRLMASFAAQLSETALTWRKAVAPYAEEAANIFWSGRSKRSPHTYLPTRLTQARRSQAKAGNLVGVVPRILETKPRCPICGSRISTGSTYCVKCVPLVNRENLLKQAKLGRIATHSPMAEGLRSATQKKQRDALRKWNPSELPGWLNKDTYRRDVLPRLAHFTVKAIRTQLDVSHPYATRIKRGTSIPHPRHWVPLLNLTGYAGPER